MCSDKDVIKWLEIPIYTGVDMAIDYIGNKMAKKYERKDFYDWGIFLKENGKLIGRLSVYDQNEDRRMADLVWFMNGKFSGKGYATEAARAVIDYLEKEGFERIEAFSHVDNLASIKVMKKIGMQEEGTLRKHYMLRDGSLHDSKMYSKIIEK